MQIINEKPEPGLEEFVPEFIENRTAEIEHLSACLAKSDFVAISKLAHTWKGFSRPFGFVLLESLAKDLELAAKNSDLSRCAELSDEIRTYIKLKANTVL
jgi:HPt (histidine-containing phosphotransfer) domain-containing protein